MKDEILTDVISLKSLGFDNSIELIVNHYFSGTGVRKNGVGKVHKNTYAQNRVGNIVLLNEDDEVVLICDNGKDNNVYIKNEQLSAYPCNERLGEYILIFKKIDGELFAKHTHIGKRKKLEDVFVLGKVEQHLLEK